MTLELASATLAAQAAAVRDGAVTAVALVDGHLRRIDALDALGGGGPGIGAYLHVDRAGAQAAAAAIDAARAAGAPLGPLAGVPVALKDNLVTVGQPTTAGSRILAGWMPPYDATCVARLRAAGAVLLGKTNLDEFGMGSSTENSAYQVTRNPWDLGRVPGGSSGGSAAAVAAGLAAGALGTDTGGSIRQPAAMCGVVGLKPTYGRVSRWGVIGYASSLDQVGPFGRTVLDAALLLDAIAGHDPHDATCSRRASPGFAAALGDVDVRGLRVGLPREYFEAGGGPDGAGGIDGEVRAGVEAAIAALRDRGAIIVDVTLPHTRHALPAYYLIAPAEASSNLARYDGVRFGLRAPGAGSLAAMYEQTRAAGFGPEVKRRIMLGTFALRAGHYDAYYRKAQQVRALIARDFTDAFATVDVLLTPTAPTTAWPLGGKTLPLELYLADVFTLGCNLAGLPGISVPCGRAPGGLPIGAQLLAPPWAEATLLRAAAAIEAADLLGGARPPLAEVA